MSKGYNHITLLGRLTRDPEVRTTTSGKSVTSFSLAVSRGWRDAQGNPQEQVSFINCVAWGNGGETIAKYVSKGEQLLVGGRLDQRTYEKDGTTMYAFEVYVETFNFVGSGKQGDDSAPAEPQNNKPQDVVIDDIDDRPIDLSEIPF